MKLPTALIPVLLLARLASLGAAAEADARPPVAPLVPTRLEAHGHVRVDNYYWLRERENPAVIEYLQAENAYTEQVMAPFQELQQQLFAEIKQRIKQADSTVPVRERDYEYYTRFETGKQYPLYCRRPLAPPGAEQVMLDVNLLAAGSRFCAVRGVSVSSGQNLLAFAVDKVGRRQYTIRFKDLVSGELLDDEIAGVTGNLTWAEDNQTLFYSRQDAATLRPYQIYRHVLGQDQQQDQLVYEEPNSEFRCFVSKTRSRKYILVHSSQTLSDEVRFVDAARPADSFRLFMSRRRHHEYSIEHHGGHFYIRTNDQAANFRLMKCPVTHTGRAHWSEVISHRPDVYLQGVTLFKDYLVITERRQGLVHLRIRPWTATHDFEIEFAEPAYVASVGDNREFTTNRLRYRYTSLKTPQRVVDYDMRTKTKTIRKQDPVLGGFSAADYGTERLMAPARDGVSIPVSLVYRKEVRLDGSAPCLLYGYGSYGASVGPRFVSHRLNLLDRGFVFAIAHVRGGQELGREWYENGKLLTKMNTFTDFIDVADCLVQRKYADPRRLYAQGGSAGGLLMAAVLNLRPDLFDGVVAQVPFVDVLTTMLDENIPLTTNEYDEWGNPHHKPYHDYILSYSPYDNVLAQAYPHLLVTAGLHDSQVQYWEPAKWVAKLRATKIDDNLLLLKTNLQAGHGGPSGRFDRYRETALQHAFLLRLAEIDR